MQKSMFVKRRSCANHTRPESEIQVCQGLPGGVKTFQIQISPQATDFEPKNSNCRFPTKPPLFKTVLLLSVICHSRKMSATTLNICHHGSRSFCHHQRSFKEPSPQIRLLKSSPPKIQLKSSPPKSRSSKPCSQLYTRAEEPYDPKRSTGVPQNLMHTRPLLSKNLPTTCQARMFYR